MCHIARQKGQYFGATHIILSNKSNWTPRLDLHPQLLFLRKSYSRKSAPLQNPFLVFTTLSVYHILLNFRVGLSKLNLHKFQHNFRDTLDPMCPLNDGIEDTEHFLLLCPSFDLQRQDLLAGVLAILRPFGQDNLSNKVLTQYLLYGNKDLPIDLNRKILELTLAFIHNTGRFDRGHFNLCQTPSNHQVPLFTFSSSSVSSVI